METPCIEIPMYFYVGFINNYLGRLTGEGEETYHSVTVVLVERSLVQKAFVTTNIAFDATVL
jgi:hypothetical protein